MNFDWFIKFFVFGKNILIKLVYVLIGIVCFILEIFNINIIFLIIILFVNVYIILKWKLFMYDYKGSYVLFYSFNWVGKNFLKVFL